MGDSSDLSQTRLPRVMDWRRTNAITPVKTQGGCNSCWAFSAAEEVEAMYVIQVDDTAQQIFSPQQITSCTPDAKGCGGGYPAMGFSYLQGTGLAQEVFWPFSGGLIPSEVCDNLNCTEACEKDLSY